MFASSVTIWSCVRDGAVPASGRRATYFTPRVMVFALGGGPRLERDGLSGVPSAWVTPSAWPPNSSQPESTAEKANIVERNAARANARSDQTLVMKILLDSPHE